ncbi:hypothetical protein ES319_D06G233500v1 [Gossypium barbadense]|uniref:LOB domain-containing protein n=3 Tax=Gossypium TaxID=3633 RepID=A0A5J5R5J2_GOSBA|nr:hypothetical protein ES319_D06G233500v1 [Gossypium barbadense]PPD88625.1 hypothetical protein GOBAR_DD14464 [Gossypium barbadense]TYG66173.1 hypothetical protein ES288_D06G246400v1 [Gossypium darwinii]TYH68325.1 hypothetical protein ES332_D06G251000v1 [Gossypium tomentosum]
MSIPTSGNTAIVTEDCLACKYQRRRCPAYCLFAPYFPHGHEQQLKNMHKLFGSGMVNVIKLVRTIEDPSKKDIAIRTIMVQSDMRAKDPVGGCYRVIQELQHQIECTQAELDQIYYTIAICRTQNAHRLQMQKIDDGDRCQMMNKLPLIGFETEKLANLSIKSDDNIGEK